MRKTTLTILASFTLSLCVFYLFQSNGFKLGQINKFEFEQELRRGLDRVLPERILDSVWNDFFHYFTNFDSGSSRTVDENGAVIEGFTFENSGSLGFNLDGWFLETVTTTVAQSYLQKVQIPTLFGGPQVSLNRNLSWNEPQRFRANFSFDDQSNPASPRLTAYIVRGAVLAGGYTHPFYGFRISTSTNASTSLWGVSGSAGTVNSSVLLYERLATSTAYIVEAGYFPNDKIVFKVINTTSSLMENRGVLTTGLPSSTSTLTSTFYGMELNGVGGNNTVILGSFFEYIQKIRRF